jgi:hypothetical protein
MPVPTQSTPVYKKRRITVMLEEPRFQEMSRSLPDPAPSWSPKFVSAVVGLAILSALGVFLVLYHHDRSAVLSPGPVAAVAPFGDAKGNPGSLPQDKAGAVQRPAPSAANDLSVPAPIKFKFKLKRSRTYEDVGPVGMRLLRVNLRRRACDLILQLNSGRTLQKHAQLNRASQFKVKGGAEPLQITVSEIGRDSVVGFLSAVPARATPVRK